MPSVPSVAYLLVLSLAGSCCAQFATICHGPFRAQKTLTYSNSGIPKKSVILPERRYPWRL